MKKTPLTGTDLQVSAISLGTDLLGGEVDVDASFRLLDRYVELGGTMIDTAHVYNNWIPGEKSRSEKTIGRWLKERGMRNRVVVATKGGCPELTSLDVPRLSKEEIVGDLDESLQFLDVDRIDLYWLHRDDRSRPVADILNTMNEQVKAGKIRYFGCSNWQIDRIEEASQYAKAHGLEGFVGSQLNWSLALPDRATLLDPNLAAMNEPSLAYYKQKRMFVFAYYSIAKGYFARMQQLGPDGLNERVRKMYHNALNFQRYERARALADKLSVSISAIVLAYIYSQPFPAIPIVGCRSIEQLEDLLAYSDFELTDDMIGYLEHGKENGG